MLMPGRGGSLINGEWQENGPAKLANLSVDNRSGNQPLEYVALESIVFLPGFESGVNDEFVAYITTSGTGGSEGGDGLYRYGFNGKENDNETGTQDYGMRIYNPGLGRFLSVDPLTSSFPFYAPYQFAGNKPIYALDLDGAEELPYLDQYQYNGSWGWFDRLKAVPNAAGKIYNHALVGTWNSGVANVRSLARGTWTEDVSRELKQIGTGIKNEAIAAYNYHTTISAKQQIKDLGSFFADPERGEDILEYGFGIFSGNMFINGKGNLLKPATNMSVVAAMEIRITTTNNLFGGNAIRLASNKTTTVIGRFKGGVEHVVATGQFRTGINTGGLNILSIRNWTWEANKAWLNAAIKRNDIIRVVSDQRKLENIWEHGKVGGNRTTFGREVELLENAGYKFNEKTSHFFKE